MYILGIDVGTTGTKTMLLNDKGRVLGSSYKGYKLINPGPNRVEQRAEDWWDALVYTVRECTSNLPDKHNISSMAISSQGSSLVPVDVYGAPMQNVIVWMDNRGENQLHHMLKQNSDEFYYRKTGWKMSTWGNAIQIKWLSDNEKEVFNKAYKFLSTMDFINMKLTGSFVIDPTNAAITQLMDISTGKWDETILSTVGIGTDKLPEILKSGTVIGNLTSEAAAELGLDTSVKVVNGGHDQYCVAAGTGTVNEGDLILSTGTAWVIFGVFASPPFDSNNYIAPGPHIIDGLWGAIASVPTAGVCMEWFRDNFALKLKNDQRYETENFKDIDKKAELLMERSRDLFFYPYYNGSGYPKWNTKVKAGILGLGLEHDRYDIARAVMEGVAFEANQAVEQFRQKGCRGGSVKMLGGASRSNLWSEIIANTTGNPVVRLKEADVACVGAGIIAGVGSGIFSDFNDGYDRIEKEEMYTLPEGDKVAFYKEKYQKYKKGIKAMEEFYGGADNEKAI